MRPTLPSKRHRLHQRSHDVLPQISRNNSGLRRINSEDKRDVSILIGKLTGENIKLKDELAAQKQQLLGLIQNQYNSSMTGWKLNLQPVLDDELSGVSEANRKSFNYTSLNGFKRSL